MKAFAYEKYGCPEEVLQLKELARPEPGDNELEVQIHATCINDYDWSMTSGKPRIYRLMYGLTKPKNTVPGMELSGTVVRVGKAVQNFKPGDAVFGDTSEFGFGTFAEYVCINEKAMLKKPKRLDFEEAAAIPHAFCLAQQALCELGQMHEGQKILINGGGGGGGILGLQLAKSYSCEVTGVDSEAKRALMLSFGFDHFIDYQKENFTQNGIQYDVILDCKTNKPARSYLGSLKRNGKYISIGGEIGPLIRVLLGGKLVAPFTSKKLKILPLKPNKGLDVFLQLFEKEQIKAHIDGPYTMEEIPKLVQYFGEGKHKGKVVVKIT